MDIETLNDLAAAFGNKKATAQWFGVSPSALSQWQVIPPRHHRRIMAEAKRRRWKLADRLFENGR